MIISHSKKFIFIHLEKCGGTSIEAALAPTLGKQDLLIGGENVGESIQSRMFEQYGTQYTKNNLVWKHSTAKQAFRYIGRKNWAEYKKFTVVREPVSLAKSLFAFSQTSVAYHLPRYDHERWPQMVKDRNFPDQWPYHDEYIRAYIYSHVTRTKFDGFINYLIRYDADCFSSYYDRIRPNYFDNDMGMIVDLSQLNDRWGEICDYISVPATKLQQLNTSGSKDLVIKGYTEQKIRDHFALDYQRMPMYTGVTWQ